MSALLPSLLVALGAPLWAADAALSVPAQTVSLGRGRRVTGTLAYDPRKAAEGGVILAAARLGAEHAAAARLAEGVITADASYFGWAAVVARRSGAPVLSVPRALWQDGAFYVEEPLYGAPEGKAPGFRAAAGAEWRRLNQGEVVTLDPALGALIVHPKEDYAFELSLAAALRAYDGLKDRQALIQWHAGWAEQSPERTGARLLDGLGARVAEGSAPPADFAALRKLVENGVPRERRGALSGRLRELVARRSRAAIGALSECEAALREAVAAEAAERWGEEARRIWGGLEALAAAAGAAPAPEARRMWLRVSSAAREQAERLRETSTVTDFSSKADALPVERATLPASLYARFMSESGLDRAAVEIANDASLDLARKARRLRDAFEAVSLPPESPLARSIASRAPGPGPYAVISEPGTRRTTDAAGLAAAVKDAWADSWEAGPLGARKRRGELEPRPEVVLERLIPADVSGVALSRDPGSGSRSRVLISASLGVIEGLAAGRPADQILLDRSGAELAVAVGEKRERFEIDARGRLRSRPVRPADARRPALDRKRLKRVLRLVRAWDDHFGRGVELEFAFAGETLYWLRARPLPQPPAISPGRAAGAAPAAPRR